MANNIDEWSPEKTVDWLRSHPFEGWDEIPDDFEFIPSAEGEMRPKGKRRVEVKNPKRGTGKNADIVPKDNVEPADEPAAERRLPTGLKPKIERSAGPLPLDSAWSLLKTGR